MATATPNVYTLSLHDALPISQVRHKARVGRVIREGMFARRALRPISDSIGRNPQQPGHERSEEHTSELQSRRDLVCRLLLEKKKQHIHAQHLRYLLAFSA